MLRNTRVADALDTLYVVRVCRRGYVLPDVGCIVCLGNVMLAWMRLCCEFNSNFYFFDQ